MTATNSKVNNFNVKGDCEQKDYLEVLQEQIKQVFENQEKALNYSYHIIDKIYKILDLDLSFKDSWDFYWVKQRADESRDTELFTKKLNKGHKSSEKTFNKFAYCFDCLVRGTQQSLQKTLNNLSLKEQSLIYLCSVEFLIVKNYDINNRINLIGGLQRMMWNLKEESDKFVVEEVINMLLNPELALK